MPVELQGSCRCGAVRFTVLSHTPQPYQLCYCSICRKTAGGGGYAINLGALADTLKVVGRRQLRIWQATLREESADGTARTELSPAQRHFCARCATALWLFDPRWPELLHPFASAIDSPLPVPPARVHLMLADKPAWVVPSTGPGDDCFDGYPELSIEDWHKKRGLWVD
jgi:hypothetical protein